MSLVASRTALPSAVICAPWLVIEPPLAISERLPPALRLLTRASLVEWLWLLFERWLPAVIAGRSEEHTSELQSQSNLVCRLLLEKKKEPPPGTARHVHPSWLPP